MTKISKKHILIFEPQSGGHRREFLDHLLSFIQSSTDQNNRYTFVVQPELLKETTLPKNVEIKEVQPFSKSRDLLLLLQKVLEELKPDYLIIMDLTNLEGRLCFWRPPVPFSGILFVQYPELSAATSIKGRLKFWWKTLKTTWFLKVAQPKKIFLLNGDFSCTYLNKRFKTSCYLPLPDPILEGTAESVSIRKEFKIDETRRIFLFFGSMSKRKGVEELLSAMQALPPEMDSKVAFIFCGTVEPHYTQKYYTLIEDFKKLRPTLPFFVNNSFVSDGRMRALFEQADWIVLPYTRPEYSSGVLGHAANAGTPVITTEKGLIARQVRTYKLGITTSDLKSALITAAQTNHSFDEKQRSIFIEKSSPKRFASILFNTEGEKS